MLEDDLHIPLSSRNVIDRCSANEDEPAVRVFQSCNKAQQRGLATRALPDDDEELPGANVQVRLVYRDNRIESLAEALYN